MLLNLAMTGAHIRLTDNDSLLHSITPVGYNLCHRPRAYGLSGGVGFLSIIMSSSKMLIVLPICHSEILLLPLGHLLDPL